MKNLIFFDDDNWVGLLPLTFTRPVCELRIGILTIREKWLERVAGNASFITQGYLMEKYPVTIDEDNFIINSTVLPDDKLVKMMLSLEENTAIVDGDELLVARLSEERIVDLMENRSKTEIKGIDISGDEDKPARITRPYDLFSFNAQELRKDFKLITAGRESAPIPESNQVLGAENIFLEEGATIEMAMLDGREGPIYVGHNAEIMPGSMVTGGLAMCEHAVLKLGAKIYGATTLGPYVKVGGEVNNVVFLGYANKGHDGFLGNAVIGAWCNLGADTNSSNLKNNYSEVKLWSYKTRRFEPTGLQFCGLIMGDHAKCGINTMFNTGTVVGVSANVFGSGFPRNYIPSYAWGGHGGFTTYKFEKAMETAELVMARRKATLDDVEKNILKYVFELTRDGRSWEKSVK